MPPTPMPAMLSLLLGASGPPSTRSGSRVKAEAATVVVCKKERRVVNAFAGVDAWVAGLLDFMVWSYLRFITVSGHFIRMLKRDVATSTWQATVPLVALHTKNAGCKPGNSWA